jgi:hypothetical protein
MDFADLGSSAISGGLLGTVGTALGRVTGFFERRAEHAQERERWAHELRLEERRAHATETAADASRRADMQTARFEGLTESLRGAAGLDSGYKWVAAIRSLVRPVLTPFLWILYLIVFFSVMSGSADRYLAEAVESEFLGYFISNIAFTASAATLWWFGDRARPNWPMR